MKRKKTKEKGQEKGRRHAGVEKISEEIRVKITPVTTIAINTNNILLFLPQVSCMTDGQAARTTSVTLQVTA